MKRDYRQDFPLLRENPIVYLDSAATAQRPDVVIEAEMEFYRNYNANPLRGLYSLGMCGKIYPCSIRKGDHLYKKCNGKPESDCL